jgi:hypothetical protein
MASVLASTNYLIDTLKEHLAKVRGDISSNAFISASEEGKEKARRLFCDRKY